MHSWFGDLALVEGTARDLSRNFVRLLEAGVPFGSRENSPKKSDVAMGQDPNRTPGEHPNPHQNN